MNTGYTLKAPLKYYNNTFFQTKGETQKIDNRLIYIYIYKRLKPTGVVCHKNKRKRRNITNSKLILIIDKHTSMLSLKSRR